MSSIQLLTLPPSPNNMKVRAALGYLGLPYEELPQQRDDRSALIAASGQPLTPVMVKDGIGMFDSGAILRHLHCTTPGSTLFPQDPDAMRKLESWESAARYGVKDSIGPMYWMFFGRMPATAEAQASAAAALLVDTEALEKALAKRPFLLGDQPCAADFTWAGILAYNVGLETPRLQAAPFFENFKEHFTLSEQERPLVRAWVRTLLQYDAWIHG
jgi:glutathione S-transferase